jgi:hypothetical protein
VVDAFPQEKLEAAGCPRLAFLLGMREAADPLEEEIARWRLWLIPPDAVQRGMRLKKRGLPKIRRGGYASLEELMRLIDSIFLLKSVELFVHTHCLWPLQEYETDEEEENEREREAYRRYLEARRAIIAEIARLGKLVEAGPRSPEMDRALERYIEDVYSRVTVEFPVESEEAARALAKRGAEVRKSGGTFTVRARRPRPPARRVQGAREGGSVQGAKGACLDADPDPLQAAGRLRLRAARLAFTAAPPAQPAPSARARSRA